ncbi:hypothetical protein TSO5_05080 [Azospirillum sp. TSO5]|nr:hypothetical protein TSO5_05080 [Azospirillum sp. TSO5]
MGHRGSRHIVGCGSRTAHLREDDAFVRQQPVPPAAKVGREGAAGHQPLAEGAVPFAEPFRITQEAGFAVPAPAAREEMQHVVGQPVRPGQRAEIRLDLARDDVDGIAQPVERLQQALQPAFAGPLVVVDEGDQRSRRLGHAAVAGEADARTLLQDVAQRHAPQSEGGLPALDDRAPFRQRGIVDHEDFMRSTRRAAHPLPDQTVQAGTEQFRTPMGADDDAGGNFRAVSAGDSGGRHGGSPVSGRRHWSAWTMRRSGRPQAVTPMSRAIIASPSVSM